MTDDVPRGEWKEGQDSPLEDMQRWRREVRETPCLEPEEFIVLGDGITLDDGTHLGPGLYWTCPEGYEITKDWRVVMSRRKPRVVTRCIAKTAGSEMLVDLEAARFTATDRQIDGTEVFLYAFLDLPDDANDGLLTVTAEIQTPPGARKQTFDIGGESRVDAITTAICYLTEIVLSPKHHTGNWPKVVPA